MSRIVPTLAGALTSGILIYGFATHMGSSSRQVSSQLNQSRKVLASETSPSPLQTTYPLPQIPFREHIKAQWNSHIMYGAISLRDADYEGFAKKIQEQISKGIHKILDTDDDDKQ